MGTNYYTTIVRIGCTHCGQQGPWTDRLHIGKSSGGWRFCFRVYREEDQQHFGANCIPSSLGSLAEWRGFLASHQVFDEYGKDISQEDFWGMVEAKADGVRHERNGKWEHAGAWSEGPADFWPVAFS